MVVLVALVASTWWLCGMIWMVQLVHYPLFSSVGEDGFAAYEAAHSTRISWLLVGPWAIQGIATAWVLLAPPAGVPRWLAVLGAVLAATTVIVTVLVSVPQHEALSDGFDAAAHARLVSTNWWRTLAWTGHAVVALWSLVLHLRATS